MSLKLMCAFGLDTSVCPIVAWADGEHHDRETHQTWWDTVESGFGNCSVEDIGLTQTYPEQGIWVWEGTGSIDNPDAGGNYTGEWRKATVGEVNKVLEGQSPFPKQGCAWTATRTPTESKPDEAPESSKPSFTMQGGYPKPSFTLEGDKDDHPPIDVDHFEDGSVGLSMNHDEKVRLSFHQIMQLADKVRASCGDTWWSYECLSGCQDGPLGSTSSVLIEMRTSNDLLDPDANPIQVNCPLCAKPMVHKATWDADVDGYGSSLDGASVRVSRADLADLTAAARSSNCLRTAPPCSGGEGDDVKGGV